QLSFNERVEAIFNSIEVLDQKGNRVDDGSPHLSGSGDGLELGLKALGDGQYTVRWRINSLDGHQVQGHFGFGVNSSAPSDESMNRATGPQESYALKTS